LMHHHQIVSDASSLEGVPGEPFSYVVEKF
jgi:hypothetical protein